MQRRIPGFSPCSPTASAAPITARAPRSTSSRRSSGPSGPSWPPIPSGTLLDFGIGENDDMADPLVREVAQARDRQARKPRLRRQRHRRLQGSRRRLHEEGLRRRRSTRQTEVNHAIGSKPALAMLPACFINPGDVTLMTVPGYPVAGTHTKYYGGEVYNLPLLRGERLLSRPGLASPPTSASGPSCWSSTTPTARPARWPRATSTGRSSTSPRPTRSSSCRTRPTSC